jgi:hypothetical protein
MGTAIDRDAFDQPGYARFGQRLQQCLSALGRLLRRPGFGTGPATVGAELELFLVDGAARPLPLNSAVRAAAADPRVNVELDRFNLELNASPALLAGCPFGALGSELSLLLQRAGEVASRYGARLVPIGILPTLRRADLHPGVMTDLARYRALSAGLRQLRHGCFRIRIAGLDPLELASDDVAVEGANCSFQIHLRVNPADFGRTYNAVQLATVPVLAASGNSPTFLGHRLWDETRIALFKQSVDDRDGRGPRRRPARVTFGTGWLRDGPLELFAESVRLHQPLLPVLYGHQPPGGGDRRPAPALDELRLHQGTVWRWNRAIYDPASGGHLRIEMRALPAGPTMIDMMANAAFLIGLSLWLAGQDQRWTYTLSFERAEHSFYRAAQHGLAAQLSWPFGRRRIWARRRTPMSHRVTAEAGGGAFARQGHRLGGGLQFVACADHHVDELCLEAHAGRVRVHQVPAEFEGDGPVYAEPHHVRREHGVVRAEASRLYASARAVDHARQGVTAVLAVVFGEGEPGEG